MKLPTPNLIYILLCFVLNSWPAMSQATEFDLMVIPSLMNSEMDGWYKIPRNSGPKIHRASSVYQNQAFNLLIFFQGYSADENNNLHIRYDVQIFDPKGNPTEDKGSDLMAYSGPMGNPQALVLSQQFLKIVLTDKYQLGTYKIKATAYDKISNRRSTSETHIELIPFSLPKKFTSQQEAADWMMGYYQNPTPVKAISGINSVIEVDSNWVNKNLNILTFFRRIFLDTPFLLDNISKHFNSFSKENQKKLLLISAIANDSLLLSAIPDANKKELEQFYQSARRIHLPDVNKEINSPVQLDILWSEFLATGKYEPIRKIVSALALEKYKGTLEKLKAGKLEKTKEIERDAFLEATYGSAIWSLISNSQQMPLVFKYCIFMYQNEDLKENIKSQLGSILHAVQREMQKTKENTQ